MLASLIIQALKNNPLVLFFLKLYTAGSLAVEKQTDAVLSIRFPRSP